MAEGEGVPPMGCFTVISPVNFFHQHILSGKPEFLIGHFECHICF